MATTSAAEAARITSCRGHRLRRPRTLIFRRGFFDPPWFHEAHLGLLTCLGIKARPCTLWRACWCHWAVSDCPLCRPLPGLWPSLGSPLRLPLTLGSMHEADRLPCPGVQGTPIHLPPPVPPAPTLSVHPMPLGTEAPPPTTTGERPLPESCTRPPGPLIPYDTGAPTGTCPTTGQQVHVTCRRRT